MVVAQLTYRTKGGNDNSIDLHTNTAKVVLDYRPIDTIDLTPLKHCPDLRELSLRGCTLDSIILSPLQDCHKLNRLDLSGNRLTTIDLTPLSDLRELEYLNLSSNGLGKINLEPLINIAGLKGLFLGGNGIQEVDVTPLALCSQLKYLAFGRDIQVNADHLLQYYSSKTVKSTITLFIDSVPAATEVIRSMVEVRDCREIQKVLLRMLESETKIMERQYHILRVLGFPELAAFDGPLSSLIQDAPVASFEEFTQFIYDEIIKHLEMQIDTGGFTAFIDIERLSQTYAARLIPKILERRKHELENTSVFVDKGGNVDLTPLWITSFGYSLLKVLDSNIWVNRDEFEEIKPAFKQAGFKINISHVYSSEGVVLSREMREFILSIPI